MKAQNWLLAANVKAIIPERVLMINQKKIVHYSNLSTMKDTTQVLNIKSLELAEHPPLLHDLNKPVLLLPTPDQLVSDVEIVQKTFARSLPVSVRRGRSIKPNPPSGRGPNCTMEWKRHLLAKMRLSKYRSNEAL